MSASVKPDIAEQMLVVDTAKKFWDELYERFGQSNAPELCMLKKELNAVEQNNMSVSEYYGKLKGYWDRISSLEGFPECSCGHLGKCTCNVVKKLMEREEKNKVINFLMKLNGGYDNVRQNIIGMDPLPSVNKAHQMVMQIEKQKEILGTSEVSTEASALATSRQNFITYPRNNYAWREKGVKRGKNEEDLRALS